MADTDGGWTEIHTWIAGNPRLTVAETADLIDAIDPLVDPLRQMQALHRLADTNRVHALIYLRQIAGGLVTSLGPTGSHGYLAHLRHHAALGGA